MVKKRGNHSAHYPYFSTTKSLGYHVARRFLYRRQLPLCILSGLRVLQPVGRSLWSIAKKACQSLCLQPWGSTTKSRGHHVARRFLFRRQLPLRVPSGLRVLQSVDRSLWDVVKKEFFICHNIILLIPSLISGTLKFIRYPSRFSVSFI